MNRAPSIEFGARQGQVWIAGQKARRVYNSGCRIHFWTSEFVMKIDDEMWDQAALEVEVMKKAVKLGLKHYLVPILVKGITPWHWPHYGDRGFTVQNRLKLKDPKYNVRLFRDIQRVIELLDLEDVSADGPDPEDPDRRIFWNWGINRATGKPVIYDYGV